MYLTRSWILLFYGIFLGIFLQACQPKVVEESAPSSPGMAGTFSSLNAEVFQVHCLGCHSSAADNGIDFSTYDTLMSSMNSQSGLAVLPGAPQSSRIWIRTRPTGGMPPDNSDLPTDANAAIAEWISNGAIED